MITTEQMGQVFARGGARIMNLFDRMTRFLTPRPHAPVPSRVRRVRLQVESLERREVPAAIATPPIFQNPFMARNDFSEIHLNSYQTDTFSVRGPGRGTTQTVQQGSLDRPTRFAIGGTVAFNKRGQILTIRTGQTSGGGSGEVKNTLLLIDPVTLKVLASTPLPSRQAGGSG